MYTPEITRSHYQHPLIIKLLSDQIKGKQSSISSRVALHRDIWPTIKEKEKLTGYEGPTAAASWNNVPTYFKDFSEQNKKIKTVLNSKFSFSEEEFKNIFHIK